MGNKLRFIHSPLFLFRYAVIALTVPNLALSITDSMPLGAAIANICLPMSAYAIVMSLSRRPGRQVWILFPLVFFAAFQMVLVYLYGGGVIATDMFLNLITTNPGEAMELLDNLVPAVAGVFVLYLPLLIVAAVQWSRHITLGDNVRRRVRSLAMAAGAVATLLTASLYFVYPKGEEKAGRFEYRIENHFYPINVFYNLYLTIHESGLSAHYQESVAQYRFNSISQHDKDSTEVYIMVVGETARSRNFQLYGYPRQTNPRLSKEKGLMVFKDIRSQSNTTHKSVPMLLTAANAEDHDRLYHEKGIIAAFREAGFRTAFFSNQQRNHSYIDFLGEEANDVCFIREHTANEFTCDSQLLPYVRRELAKRPRKLFIVLHMYYPTSTIATATQRPARISCPTCHPRQRQRTAHNCSTHTTTPSWRPTVFLQTSYPCLRGKAAHRHCSIPQTTAKTSSTTTANCFFTPRHVPQPTTPMCLCSFGHQTHTTACIHQPQTR